MQGTASFLSQPSGYTSDTLRTDLNFALVHAPACKQLDNALFNHAPTTAEEESIATRVGDLTLDASRGVWIDDLVRLAEDFVRK